MTEERIKELAQRFHESTVGCHPEDMPAALEKLILVVTAEARKEGIDEMFTVAKSEMWAVWLRTKDVRDIESRLKTEAERLKEKL